MQSRPHLLWSAMLAAGLLGPLALRERSRRFEVYPAVLLPSGAYLTRRTDSTYRYTSLELSAFDTAARAWVEVRERDLLHPLPGPTVNPVLRKLVGASEGGSARQRGELLAWLAPRLRDGGYDAGRIRVLEIETRIPIDAAGERALDTLDVHTLAD